MAPGLPKSLFTKGELPLQRQHGRTPPGETRGFSPMPDSARLTSELHRVRDTHRRVVRVTEDGVVAELVARLQGAKVRLLARRCREVHL